MEKKTFFTTIWENYIHLYLYNQLYTYIYIYGASIQKYLATPYEQGTLMELPLHQLDQPSLTTFFDHFPMGPMDPVGKRRVFFSSHQIKSWVIIVMHCINPPYIRYIGTCRKKNLFSSLKNTHTILDLGPFSNQRSWSTAFRSVLAGPNECINCTSKLSALLVPRSVASRNGRERLQTKRLQNRLSLCLLKDHHDKENHKEILRKNTYCS